MKLRVTLALAGFFVFPLFAALPPEYEALKADAEKLYADGSFARANERYGSRTWTNLPPAEQRWVKFRLADTQWRSQAATETSDTTKLDTARQQLEVLVRDVSRPEDRDRVWVEVQESLGDFFWIRRNQQNWGAAWPHYQLALDWWAGAPDIELARDRYLKMVWRLARPPGMTRDYYYGYWGNYVPLEVLDNALKIARADQDRAHAHYLIAMTLRSQGGSWEQRARVPEEFEGALKPGNTTEWYDDALYNYAEWMATQGRTIPMDNGAWRAEPDFVKALELFRRLVREFNKGETRYYDNAQQQIKNITDPQVGVSVGTVFLPDSEIQYYLSWRNVKQVQLALYPVELNRDVKLTDQQGWLASINLRSLERIKSWSHDTKDQGNYRPGNDTLRLDGKLKPGAYVLEARAEDKTARELILVTDAALVLKTSSQQALVYFCNALDGSPIASGQVKLWEQWWDNSVWHTREQTADTSRDGIAVFKLEDHRRGNTQFFASAMRGDRQTFSVNNGYWSSSTTDPWRIYAFTDRPAYRPKETVNWKFIARRFNGPVYVTPSDQKIEFEIFDPRGTKVKADKATLNSFGSAWGSLELTEQMPLGEYLVQFWNEGHSRNIGSATLFRLEEYKLPEFKVTVQTPEEDGRRKSFRLGEKVEATIQADYYFGGPVANASVEVIVYQSPFWHWWHEARDFPWFYDDMDNNNSPYGRWRGDGGGQIFKRETLKTDATGKATIAFDTTANAGQDFEYRIEARVTDSSRREITGNGSVRVTRQRYYVYPQAAHNLYRPQDKVTVNFKALDANEQPVTTEGMVKVTRDYWFEIWLAPDGREVKGDELKRLQTTARIWPPPPARPDQRGWRLKFRGYEHDDILTRTLKTDTNGAAEFNFTPEREGYYRVAWTGEDTARSTNQTTRIPSPPITANTTVWVAQNATTDLGYRHGGVEIIADKDTFRVGTRAPVMLVANSPDRYVLFSVESKDLYSYQLVHLDGTVKLLELPIEEKHVPNIFLSALLVSDRQIFTDTKQVVVPPTKNFLTLDVKPDQVQRQPREEGSFTITAKNDEGKPVSAEVSLGLVDESVFYIQKDYAGDPRQYYFGTKFNLEVHTESTFQQKPYAKLLEGEDKQLLDDLELDRRRAAGRMDLPESQAVGFDDAAVTREGKMQEQLTLGGSGGGGFATGIPRRSMNYRLSKVEQRASASDKFSLAAAEAPAAMPAGGEPAVVVRSDFRSTVFWQPDVVTDKNGKATVKFKYPDSTTSWKATARAVSTGNQFGTADATTRTKQPLIVRLQAPRFFVAGDTVTLSAVVNNNTDEPLEAKVALEAQGISATNAKTATVPILGNLPVYAAGKMFDGIPAIKVAANGEARVDWTAHVERSGELKLKVTGRAGKYSDAMEKTYTAYEHGIEKFITKSGKARGNDITVKLDLPRERKAGSTLLTVQLTPSLAVTMLDALPYLIDYPYGCTEQTMSRFLPAIITAKTLRDLGLKPEDIMGRVFGGIEPGSAAATHPRGKRDLAELDEVTQAGLERLYDFQHGDGGWGWWKLGESDHWMTAYVVWGLSLARDVRTGASAGNKLENALARAASFLDKEIVEEEENPDMQAWMLHALAACNRTVRGPSEFQTKAFDNLWQNREKLNAYTRALLALTADLFGNSDRAKTLIANLENGVKRDNRPDTSVLTGADPSHLTPDPSVQGTAHWGEDGIYWRWSEGGVEATAFALRALLKIDPANKLIEPVTNWLIKNRRGVQWNSTRDTAIVVLAMNDYLRTSGELKTDAEYELTVNGTSVAKKKVAGAELFAAPSRFAIDPKLIKDGNEIRIRQSGREPRALYFAAEAKFFSLEEPIAPVGHEIFVKRDYYKLVGRPTLLKGYVYDREPLRDGDQVRSGERVETLLTIEAKNNYEYLMFEDLKPAGLEAVEVRSGESLYASELKSGAVEYKFRKALPAASAAVPGPGEVDPATGLAAGGSPPVLGEAMAGDSTVDGLTGLPLTSPPEDYTGRTRWIYQELRDRKVALFIDKLPEGVWEIRYDLRAEVPGKFHALPVVGQAMYVPEIRCNGSEVRINVTESKE